MLLRRSILVCFCAVAALGLGLYVYQTNAYLVWGLLFLCWGCYRLKMRAERLFGPLSACRVTAQGGLGETLSLEPSY